MQISRRSILQAAFAFSSLATLRVFAASKLRIGIIGSGSLGSAVGRAWVKNGHQVMFSSRHPDELKDMVNSMGPLASSGSVRQAAQFGNVVLVAVPYAALPEVGRDLKDLLRGKIVLDATNPRVFEVKLLIESKRIGVGALSAQLLPGVRLVRAFSAVNASAIEASANHQRSTVAVPIASDDSAAMEVAAQLVRDAGCAPVKVGDLASSRAFEDGTPACQADTDELNLRRILKLPPG